MIKLQDVYRISWDSSDAASSKFSQIYPAYRDIWDKVYFSWFE